MPIYMKHRERIVESKSGFWHGALWAFISAVIAFIFLFFSAYGFSAINNINADTAEALAYIVYNLIIGVACYLICRRYPGSILVVPLLANVMGIVSSIAEPNFWSSSIQVLVICGWILSIAASLAGYMLSHRRNKGGNCNSLSDII